jgi:hypothetical protein
MEPETRSLRPDDDFEVIHRLRHETLRRLKRETAGKTPYRTSPQEFRKLFFPPAPEMGDDSERPYEGFVVEENGAIVAFMGLGFSPETKNGYIIPAFEPEAECHLPALLTGCSDAVRRSGGHKCMYFAALLPGQVRNGEISFWERYGFVADDYCHTLIRLDLDEWQVPGALNTAGIAVTRGCDLEEIRQVLVDDQEECLADVFEAEFQAPTPAHVSLALRDEKGDLVAVSYYKVAAFADRGADGKVYEGLGAWELGVHFRPEYGASRAEKRRFIQAVLASMKQLNVIFASARVSSRDFEAFVELLAQGFYFQGSPQASVRLTRPTGL